MDLKEKQIVYMDDKPHIKCNVVMLPTKNESSLWINCENKLKIHIKDRMCPGKQEFQYLYITLDEKLSKDEWYCSPMGIVSIYNGIEKLPSNWRKIIATTDESLILNNNTAFAKLFPQLSQQFIQHYIEEYNKGNIITKVEIEYIADYESNSMSIGSPELKITSHNTINIKPIKDIYNRKEVIKLLNDFGEHVCEQLLGHKLIMIGELDKWCKENL